MHIKRIPLKLDAQMYSAEWDVPRSAGCHLMQIVELMDAERAEIVGEAPRKTSDVGDLQSYRFGGYLFEHAMAWHTIEIECQRNAGSLVRPGEFFWCAKCDLCGPTSSMIVCIQAGHKGIYSTPDALRTDTWRLKEWKFTWKSLRRCGGDEQWDEDKQNFVPEDPNYEHMAIGMWKWTAQTMWNCWAVETQAADQEVFFVNGDYYRKVPSPMRYEMEFTPRELKENWSGIVNTARREGWI